MQIKTFSVTNHFVKALVYGASGSGKTTFAGTARNAIFASAEGGLMSIADKKPDFVPIQSLKDLYDLYNYLKTEKHSYDTVVIDSITEINEIIKMEIERKTGKGMQLQDWQELGKRIRGLLRSFRDLPMHVLFIAQEGAEKNDQTIEKYVPALNGKAATEIAYFMDIVGYLKIDPDGTRRMITLPDAKLLSKDRSGVIGNDCPVDFGVWMDRIAKIETGEQAVKTTYNGPKKKPAVKQVLDMLSACQVVKALQTIYDQAFSYDWKPEEAKEITDRYLAVYKRLNPALLFNGKNEVFDNTRKIGTFVLEANGKLVLKEADLPDSVTAKDPDEAEAHAKREAEAVKDVQEVFAQPEPA